DQRQGVDQPLGNRPIRGAGFGHAGRAVVGEDDRGGVVLQRRFDHFARIDAGAVDGAAEQLLEGDDAVAIDDEQEGEYVVRLTCYPQGQIAARGGRIDMRTFDRDLLLQMTTTYFEYYRQLRVLVFA